MVTSGGMECITLAGLALLDPGDAVAVEAPTYLGALMAFAGFEAEVAGIPMDEDGLQVDVLEARLADGLRPKLIYLIPEFQNPSGRTLALERRHALIELCRRHGVLILEDVAYREMSFDGGALPSLWSLGPDVVVQAGTFSKIFCPGVRLGWAVGPRDVIAQMAAAKQTGDQCASALAPAHRRGVRPRRALRAPDPGSRVRSTRRGWRAVERALHERMPAGVRWSEPSGGFFTWLMLPRRARRERAAPGRARGGRQLRPRPPLLPRRRRRGRAAPVLQLPARGRARGRRRAAGRRHRQCRRRRRCPGSAGGPAAGRPVHHTRRMTEPRFTFGLWTVGNPGRDPFGEPTRALLDPSRRSHKLAELGAWGVSLHDNDLVPWGTPPDRGGAHRRPLPRRARRRPASASGWARPTCSAIPAFKDGAFTSNDRGVRRAAIGKAMRAIDLSARLGRRGVRLLGRARGHRGRQRQGSARRARALPRGGQRRSSEYVIEQGYDLPFAIEPKPNEPRGDIFLPTVGHALHFITTLERPERVGVNPEVAHETMAGLSFLHGVGQALWAGKLFHIDLNGQRIGRYDQDFRFGAEDLKEAFHLVRLLERAGYDGPRHFDAHAYRSEDADGVWDFAAGLHAHLPRAGRARGALRLAPAGARRRWPRRRSGSSASRRRAAWARRTR